MVAKTKTVMESFYGTVTPNADAGGSSALLPVKASDGAPEGAKYLMEFRDVEVRESKKDNHPYINYRLAVVEPEHFENRGFFSMLYIPMPNDETSAEDRKKMTTSTERAMGQIDRILGEGSALEALGEANDVASLKSALEDLASDLEGERTVCEVRVQKADKKQIEAGYTDDKNAVRQFHAVDTWVNEDED